MPTRLLPIRFSAAPDAGTHVVAASTTRHGGVSAPPFAELNCGYSAGDEPDAVEENRRRVLEDLGLDPRALVVAGQVHGTHVAVVRAADRGRGARSPANVLPETDGLLTDVPDVPLGISTADCVPIFLHAPAAGVVGALHAGWRGMLGGILEKALAVMGDTWHITPDQVHVACGPGIGSCCFEIGADVAEEAARHPATAGHLRPTGEAKWHLDLRGHLRAQCTAAGIPSAHVDTEGPCSRCKSATFFSYRAEGPRSGRTLNIIALRQGP